MYCTQHSIVPREKKGESRCVFGRVTQAGAEWNLDLLEDNEEMISLTKLVSVEPKLKEVGGHALVKIRKGLYELGQLSTANLCK